MIFEPDELALLRHTFGPELPIDPADIALWLVADQLARSHDNLVVDLDEWHSTPELVEPAWHIADLGPRVHDTHSFAQALRSEGHQLQAAAMERVRAAAITALERTASAHELPVHRWSNPRRPDVRHELAQANAVARHTLAAASEALKLHVAGQPAAPTPASRRDASRQQPHSGPHTASPVGTGPRAPAEPTPPTPRR